MTPTINLKDNAKPNPKQLLPIKKYFLDEGVSADVYPWKDTTDVYVEVASTESDHEGGNGVYIDEDGKYIYPTLGGGPPTHVSPEDI